MAKTKFFQKQVAKITLLTLLAGNISPFLTAHADETVETIKYYRYDVNQDLSWLNKIVVKNFSDTQSGGILKESFDYASGSLFGGNDTINLDLTTGNLNAKAYWITLGSDANSDKTVFYWIKDQTDFLSKIESISLQLNKTGYNEIFANRDFLSTRINFKDWQKYEIVDMISTAAMDTPSKTLLIYGLWVNASSETTIVNDATTYTSWNVAWSTLIQQMLPLFNNNIAYKDAKFDYNTVNSNTNNTVVLWEVFKKDADNLYAWDRSFTATGFTLNTSEDLVVKKLSDTVDGAINFTGSVDFSAKEFGAGKNILFDTRTNSSSDVYGYKLGSNNVLFKWVENKAGLIGSISSISFGKNLTDYSNVIGKDVVSMQINFASGSTLKMYDFVDSDEAATALPSSVDISTLTSDFTTTISDTDKIANIINSITTSWGDFMYLPADAYNGNDNINRGSTKSKY